MKEIMRKKRKKGICYKGFIGILLFMLVSFVYPTVCYATSATMTFNVDKKNITKGDKINVSLYIESDSLIGDFETYVSYDPEILEFNPEASFIAGGDGLIKITDNNVMEGSYNRKYVINFTALEVGTSEFKIYDKPVIFDYESDLTMSISNSPMTIEVLATKTASNNANLASLKTSPPILDQEFDKDLLEYSAIVEWDVTKLIINAITEDDKAVVLVEGDTNLIVGNNIITIIVKAESKETKKYIINVNRKENTEELIDDTDNAPEAEDNVLSYIEVNSFSLFKENEDTYIQYGYRYQVIEKEEGVNIPFGYIETNLKQGDVTIVAYVPIDNLDTDYLLLYCMNNKGNKGFYQYDRTENTLQRYNEELKYNESKDLEDKKIEEDELTEKVMLLLIIVIILGGLLIVASIIFAKKYLNTKK